MAEKKTVRIGGASAGWGDGRWAAPQLINSGQVDYVIFDFLSEVYMPMAARMRRQNPAQGYVLEFPDDFGAIVNDLMARGVKLVANAGAANPRACVEALKAVAARAGASPKIACVDGDDILDRAAEFRKAGKLKAKLPEGGFYTGIHAYVGAFPIARALAMGADVVITGRIVDSALALGPLIHEFGWTAKDYDRLAAGSLIGHLLECGAQASGGLFTDWREIEDYSNIGYPIAECRADGSAVITKPEGTGGLVSVGAVAEQLLYEIADPRDYRLPDVAVDLSEVRFEQIGPNRVEVRGAKGRSPGPDYKAIATWDDGWMGSHGFVMRGPDAEDKARAIAHSVQKRASQMLRARNMPDFRRMRIEVFGNEETYGEQGRRLKSREVFCRVAMEHEDPNGIALLMREHGTACVAMAPGIAGSILMTPPRPVARLEYLFLPASEVPVTIALDGKTETMIRSEQPPSPDLPPPPQPPAPAGKTDAKVPLGKLAWVRSGDKGDSSNVGVIARRPEYLPYIAAAMDEATVRRFYAHMFEAGLGGVRRFYLPGSMSFNFMLDGALDGGCNISLRYDPFGKGTAQEVLDFPIPVPSALARQLEISAAA